MQLSKEILEQIKQTKSPEELLTLAKNNGYQLTEEEANKYFEQLNSSGELADDELDNAAGGGGCGGEPAPVSPPSESSCAYFAKKDHLYTGEPCCGQCCYYIPKLIKRYNSAPLRIFVCSKKG